MSDIGAPRDPASIGADPSHEAGAPQVSVITSFIDGSPAFFEEAVRSVLAQTYPHWELVLVNDGATGPCARLARDFAEGRPDRIRYVETDGSGSAGLSAARNTGIGRARGEFIALLDADDVWLPHKLAEQVALLEADPAVAMLYGNTLYWHGWTGRASDAHRDFIPRLGVAANRTVHPPGLLRHFLSGRAAVPCTCSTIFRRDALERVGCFASEFRGMYEDQVLYAKIAVEAPIHVSDACWDRYRQHPESMTATVFSGQGEVGARRVFLAWIERHLSARSIADPDLWRTLRHEMWLTRHERIAGGVRRFRRLLWRVGALAGGPARP
jgi:glycosyltransferase involved in cell wall biosynthesis